MGDQVIRQTKSMETIVEKFDHIMSFYEIVNQTQYEFILKNVKTLVEKEQFINDCYEHGLHIYQPPFFGTITIENMNKLYETFGYEPYHCTIGGKEIEKPLIIGNLYYLRLVYLMDHLSFRRSKNLLNAGTSNKTLENQQL